MKPMQYKELKEKLSQIKLPDGLEFEIVFDSTYGESARVSVHVPLDYDSPLPKELEPFSIKDHEIDRLLEKHNTSKESFAGARFEVALSNYAYTMLNNHPELKGKENQILSMAQEEFKAYESTRERVWEEINQRPEIVAWKKELKENYL